MSDIADDEARRAAKSAYQRQYYHAHKDSIILYKERNRERQNEAARKYYAANTEKCRAASRKWWHAERQRDPAGFWALRVYHAAKARAKKGGIPFDLDRDYIFSLYVTHCPALGLELTYNATGTPPNCASLDRIRPELGYVRGNVVVVSYLANTIKQNATAADVRAVADWMETLNGPG